jgi:hypothetical protein
MNGAHQEIKSWRLESTANAGDSFIIVENEGDLSIGWETGDEIIITSSSFDPHEAESRKIVSIDRSVDNGVMIMIDKPLYFTHNVIRSLDTIDGFIVPEVILISRRLKIRGDQMSSRHGAKLFS